MSSNYSRCPSAKQLASFSTGQLSAASLNHVAEHIADCDDCESVLTQFETDVEDELISELRLLNLEENSSGSTTVNHPDVPDELLEIARNSHYSSNRSDEITLDAGYSLAQRLKSGSCHLGRFELHSELGIGSFGHVFKAYDPELDRPVAIKVQRAGLFATGEDAQRFMREARNVAQLKHFGIVAVYDTGRSEEVCYLVTEYVEGQTLEDVLSARNLSSKEAAQIAARVCDALQYAHEQGVIHRDIKPSNVILDEAGRPHVMDFGLAKRDLDAGNTMTSDGRVMGTPAYMSPEQARGDSHYVDARSDIFSLGVMLYEMLSGERPFQGKKRMLLLQVIEDNPRPPRNLKPDISRDMETICLKALSKSRRMRYQTAAEMSDDLCRFLNNKPIKANPPGYLQRFIQWCFRYPIAASLLLAIPLISLGGFAYLSFLSKDFVHSTALESAKMEADMLEDINEFYSENVVGPLDRSRIVVTHEYATRTDSIPLPFTFMIDAGHKITAGRTGTKFNIYSNYPWRPDGGPNDDFERRALEFLSSNAAIEKGQDSYYEFFENKDEPVLRFARAQTMKQSCVQCHNEHQDSPRRNWVEGEVAGVLAITRPLTRDVRTTRSKLLSAFQMIGGLATLLIGFLFIVFWRGKKKGFWHFEASR